MTNTVTKIIKNGTEYDIYAIAGGGTTETATSTTEGVVKLGSDTVQSVAANNPSSTASRTYPVQLNADSQAVVNIPRTDTNTTYTASDFDIKDLTDSTNLRATWSGKQDALSTQTAYTSKGTSTKVATITTNTLGQVTWVSETDISFPVSSVNNKTGAVTVNEVPSSGTTGHYLKKTASGYEFAAAPGEAVSSVNTKTGAVVLDADDISDSSTTNKFVTASDKTTWNGKQDKIIAGTNISIASDGKTISATDTTYTASDFDIKDLADSTSLRTAWSNKQDALSTQTAYTSKGSATKVPQITTNTLGQVTGITEVTITQPTVNNATLTIQKNGSDVQTFTANASSDVTANIQVNEVPSTGTTGHVLTKTASGYEFAAPSGGINNVTTGTTSTVTGIWAGSETEYGNLSSTSDSVLYFTF